MDEEGQRAAASTHSHLFPTLISRESTEDRDVHDRATDTEVSSFKSYHHIIELHQNTIERALRPLITFTEISGTRKTFGRFNLVGRIGRGQYGDVYKAKSSSGEDVAVKCISKKPKKTQQFSMNQVLRHIRRQESLGRKIDNSDEAILEMNIHRIRWELFVASRLKDKNILNVLEIIDSPSSPQIWIVLPWATLGELRWKRHNKQDSIDQWDNLLKRKTNPKEVAEYVLRNLCGGLLYLLEQGCVHRDIKPSNILVDGQNANVMLSDFGNSLVTPDKLPFNDKRTRIAYQEELRKIAGTPAFIAPELCNFTAKDTLIDGPQLDIWSLGVTIFCLLENRLPFSGENEFDTYHKIVNERLPQSNDVLHDLINSQLLEKNPSRRITIQELSKFFNAPRKDERLKRFVSKFKKLSIKRKKKSKPVGSQDSDNWVPIAGDDVQEIDSDLSSAGESFDEPMLVADFVGSAKTTTKTSVSEVEENGASDSPKSAAVGNNRESSGLSVRTRTSEVQLSDKSISPIKIDTPLKNFIRTHNTPEKILEDSHTRGHQRNDSSPSHGNGHIMASKGTLNFTKYLQSQSPSKTGHSRDRDSDYNSFEDIRKYLSYAES
ncbi:LAFA_0C06898g1_1 [Lachancea sp. 'fantastica']|nr:LAFA_0C06898g1_1 [Lachancea sp. 'fantastica']